MSKYSALWDWISERDEELLTLSYEEIQAITGFPVDHSFLSFKKELTEKGFEVSRISMKRREIEFARLKK